MLEKIKEYVEYRQNFPELPLEEIGEILGGIFRELTDLGICPLGLIQSGVDPGKWRGEIDKEKLRRQKDRVNNMAVAVGKTEKSVGKIPTKFDHITMYRTAPGVYVLGRVRRAQELHAQANAVKNGGNQTFTEK